MTDVAVVGAGLAGFSAERALARAGPDSSDRRAASEVMAAPGC
jgi:cation diffusion facilitator CzcD-associated flavoprotein CzcO